MNPRTQDDAESFNHCATAAAGQKQVTAMLNFRNFKFKFEKAKLKSLDWSLKSVEDMKLILFSV